MLRWLMILLVVLSGTSAQRVGVFVDNGLILQDGAEQIEMSPGDKIYLRARHSFWNLPITKDLEYSSKYPAVASVDARGMVRAMLPGRTVISVWNDAGDNGTIVIIVRESRKFSAISWLILGLISALCGASFLKNKFRGF